MSDAVISLSLGPFSWGPSAAVLSALLALLAVSALSIWRAWQRLAAASRTRRLAVAVLNGLALLAMACLLAPPLHTRIEGVVVTLLTEGANGAQPALNNDYANNGSALAKDASTARAGPVYALPEVLPEVPGSEGSGLERLHTAGQLLLEQPGLHGLHLRGYGLSAEDWASLPATLALHWQPPTTPLRGPVDVHWPAQLDFGDTLVVGGTLMLGTAMHARQQDTVNKSGEARTSDTASDSRQNGEETQGVEETGAEIRGPAPLAQLQLLDPAGVSVDTATVADGEAFALRAVPRAPGPISYTLQIQVNGQVLSEDPVAVHVRERAPAQFLVLQSAPSFETRYLANWAADRGARLVLRSQISRDRDLVQGINLPEQASTELSTALLAATDLTLMDGRRWAALDDAQQAQLLAAVHGGMGLMLQVDEALTAWLDRPQRRALLGLQLQAVEAEQPYWLRDAAPAPPLPVAPWQLALDSAQALSTDEQGRVVEAWQAYGHGRIAVSRLRERHRWATAAETTAFNRYWARILRSLGRPQSGAHWLPLDSTIRLRPGQRSAVCARPEVPAGDDWGALATASAAQTLAPDATRSTPPSSGGDEARRPAQVAAAPQGSTLKLSFTPLATAPGESDQPLALAAHSSGAALVCGHIWPAQAGWHRLRLLDASERELDQVLLRVMADGEWRTEHLQQRVRATLAYSARFDASNAATAERAQPISPWWAWALLVLALVPLWLERRWHDARHPAGR